jgi:L-asparagine transporter-like permease
MQKMHTFNNVTTAIGLPALYLFFFIAFAIRTYRNKGGVPQENNTKQQYWIFMQVLAISFVNVVGLFMKRI